MTSRIRLGTAVLVAGLHVPLRPAKTLATIDAASGGLASGWSIAEATWGDDPVSFQNERYTIYPAEIGPEPTRRIPVLLGGHRRKALDRVARRADSWLPTVGTPSEIRATRRDLRAKAGEYGRNPAELGCTMVVGLFDLTEVPERDRRPFAGSIDQVIPDLAARPTAGSRKSCPRCPSSRGTNELIDIAAEVHGKIGAAGI